MIIKPLQAFTEAKAYRGKRGDLEIRVELPPP